MFVLQGHIDFNLWDEGFLWYGAQRVLVGDIPIRDFQAYDPTRYYWSAAIMALLNDDGVVSLRVGATLCQTIGLYISLRVIYRYSEQCYRESKLFLIAIAGLLILWMYVYYKVYDIFAALALIAMLAAVLDKPTTLRHFSLGICIGFVATIGRNHGIYGLIGCATAIISMNMGNNDARGWVKQLSVVCIGIIIGFAPVLISMLVIDGYTPAFLNSVYYLFELGATNLPLPVPWPWSSALHTLPPSHAVHGFFTGLYFLGLLIFPSVSISWILVTRKKNKTAINPGLAAAAWLSLPYAHYAFSRADVPHMSFAIFPLLIGTLLFLQKMKPQFLWPSLLGLIFTSALLMIPIQPLGKCFIVHRCVKMNVANDVISVPERKANEIRLIQMLVEKYVPDDAQFLVTPSWPGAYPLMHKKSPVFDIYNLTRRSEAFQRNEIKKLEEIKPKLVVIVEEPLDGGETHFTKYTNPLIYKYLLKNYDEIPNTGFPTVKTYLSKGIFHEAHN